MSLLKYLVIVHPLTNKWMWPYMQIDIKPGQWTKHRYQIRAESKPEKQSVAAVVTSFTLHLFDSQFMFCCYIKTQVAATGNWAATRGNDIQLKVSSRVKTCKTSECGMQLPSAPALEAPALWRIPCKAPTDDQTESDMICSDRFLRRKQSHFLRMCAHSLISICILVGNVPTARSINVSLFLSLVLKSPEINNDHTEGLCHQIPFAQFLYFRKTRCEQINIIPSTWQFLQFIQSWSELSHFLFIWCYLISVNPQAACKSLRVAIRVTSTQ